MPLDPALRARLDGLVRGTPVLLFMKGSREEPRCGFSAAAVRVLDALIPEYETLDVLEHPDVREGIKEYAGWPTIPQLWVRGELVGGSDIVSEMYASGELHRTLGVPRPERIEPQVTITDAAAEFLRQAAESSRFPDLHLNVDARFQARVGFAPAGGAELAVESNGIRLLLSPETAPRADGLVLDYVETRRRRGLAISNPKAPLSR